MPGIDEQEFRRHSDAAMQALYRALSDAADDYEFDVEFHAGALAIEFSDPPAKFVVSPNAPARQIWVSAHMKSHKLDWDEVENAFVLTGTGQTLLVLIQEAIGRQLGEEVVL